MAIWYVFGLWILWILQFVLFRPKEKRTPVQSAPQARWGIALQAVGYWAIYATARQRWIEPEPLWRLLPGVVFGLAGIGLASAGIRHLGKQWRVNAALNEDHELITSGPYRIVRHPIYASMLAMIAMNAFLLGNWPWWPIGIALFIGGIEIRVHAEDALLQGRFGRRFEEWKARVPAYLWPIR